jgi:hypothetical protein
MITDTRDRRKSGKRGRIVQVMGSSRADVTSRCFQKLKRDAANCAEAECVAQEIVPDITAGSGTFHFPEARQPNDITKLFVDRSNRQWKAHMKPHFRWSFSSAEIFRRLLTFPQEGGASRERTRVRVR